MWLFYFLTKETKHLQVQIKDFNAHYKLENKEYQDHSSEKTMSGSQAGYSVRVTLSRQTRAVDIAKGCRYLSFTCT